MENIVRSALMEFVEENDLLNHSQFGFLNGKSCVLQLLDTLDYITEAINAGDSVDVVFMDFAKAFDKVPHRRLLHKLESYGVGGKLHRFLASFLQNRTQQVMIRGQMSESCPVPSGVPQGTVLGPILFLFYIDDIDDLITCVIRKFADDTKLIQRISRDAPAGGAASMQRNLDIANDWVKLWESQFNADKFVCMHFGCSNPLHEYEIDGQIIPTEACYKDLGVWISNDLKASRHCSEIVSTATKIVHLIKRSIQYFDMNIYLLLYKALVRPRLEYASCAWNPHYVKDRENIERVRVQRLATRLIPGMRGMEYDDRLRFVKLQTLETRRMRADLILLYQMCHGLVKYDLSALFDPAPDLRLRGHEFKLRMRVTPSCDARKFFFANRVVEKWNGLPSDVVTAPSLSSFKTKLHSLGCIPEL
jgi:hypothetical protein